MVPLLESWFSYLSGQPWAFSSPLVFTLQCFQPLIRDLLPWKAALAAASVLHLQTSVGFSHRGLSPNSSHGIWNHSEFRPSCLPSPVSVVSQRPRLAFKSQIFYALSKFKSILPLPLQEVLCQQRYHLILILLTRTSEHTNELGTQSRLSDLKRSTQVSSWGTEAGNHTAICRWWVEILGPSYQVWYCRQIQWGRQRFNQEHEMYKKPGWKS